MSDTAHNHEPAHNLESLFSNTELLEFDSSDAAAGRSIAKILTFFFIYTVLAMSVAIGWSFAVID